VDRQYSSAYDDTEAAEEKRRRRIAIVILDQNDHMLEGLEFTRDTR
jgi:hypothetical protein